MKNKCTDHILSLNTEKVYDEWNEIAAVQLEGYLEEGDGRIFHPYEKKKKNTAALCVDESDSAPVKASGGPPPSSGGPPPPSGGPPPPSGGPPPPSGGPPPPSSGPIDLKVSYLFFFFLLA